MSKPHKPVVASPRWPAALAWAVAAAVPIGFLTLFFVWPVLSLLAVGFSGGLAAAAEVFTDPRSWRVLGQTFAQAIGGTVISLLLGLPAAYVLYRLDFPGRTLLRGLAAIPFVLPTVVVGVAFISLFGSGGALHWLGIDGSFAAILLAFAFFNMTLVARTVGGFWAGLDPRAELAAQMLGASPTRVFLTVTLPRLAPAISSAAALVFLFCATSFGIVLILGGRAFANLETEIYRLSVQYLDLRSAAVLSLVQVLIVVLALVAASRLRKRREQAGRFGGSYPAARVRLAALPAILVFACATLCLHLLPMASLISRSFRDAYGNFTLANYVRLFERDTRMNTTVVDAVLLSFGIAVIATAIAMVLGVLVALLASRRPRSRGLRRGISLLDGFVMLPLGVSAVTLGFGLLLTMHRPLGLGIDLRTSVVLLPIAQALVALPLVLRTLLPVLRGIDPRQREAAAMLGASPLRVLRTIDLRVLARSLGLAFGFAFATSLGEFGASSFLVRPESHTLPVMIAQLIGRQGSEHYGAALAAAVVLAVLTAATMLLAERWRGEVAAEL